jgi:DNA-binding SARP family transcriptional activator
MARVEIKLFGEVEVSWEGQLLSFPTQKATELFAYLVVHCGHAHPRASLAALLWPESDEEKARANLRQTLARLRRTLARAECLRFSGGAVQFRTDDCWCDVLEFERALSQSAARPTVEALEAAAALYRGPFLAGFYEDWVVIEQERLRTLYVEALEQLADLYTEQRAHRQAIATWRRVLREIPWHERAHRELMTLYALSGDRAAALHQYDEYVRILQNELDAKPLPEMRALYERLVRGAPIVSPTVIELAPEVPFVGRERELSTLKALWQNVQRGQGQAIFIGGEVGVGKTTFVQKFIREGGQGGRSLQGAAYASDSALPYQPLLQAVRAGLKRISDETWAQLPAPWRGELAQFVPELQEKFPDLAPNPRLPPAQGKARWFAALTGFFELLARERPLILFFDDLQWADDATLEYLGHLVGVKNSLPLLVIGTYRSEDALEGSRLRAWLDTLGPGRAFHPLTLTRLSQEETHLLLEQWLGAMAREAVPVLYDETAGNPLFVRELAHSLIRGGALSQDDTGQWHLTVAEISAAHLPESLRELIRASLRRAPERAQRLLEPLAVIRRACELPVLRELLPQSPERLLDQLEELRKVGLIVEQEGRYQFHHELARQIVYESLSTDRKKLWHKKIGQALEVLYPESSDELSGELAEHFERAQLREKAIAYAMRAGARAARSYAYGAAQRFYAKAIELFDALEREKTLSMQWQRTRLELYRRYLSREVFPTIYDLRNSSEQIQNVIAQMIATAEKLNDLEALCEAHQHRARVELAWGRLQEAQESMQRALSVAHRTQHPAVIADALQGVASLRARCGEYQQAVQDFQRYVDALIPLGDARRLGYALNDLALAQRACGEFAQAQQSLAKADEQFRQMSDLWGQAAVSDNMGCILRDLGRYAEAQSYLERALELNRATGDQRGIGCSLVDLGVLRNDQGDYAGALEYLDRVVELLDQPGMKGLAIEAFSEKARAHLGRGEIGLARECSTRAMELLEAHGGVIEQPYRFYFTHARVLEQSGQGDAARHYLERAWAQLQRVAQQIPDENLREHFLKGVPTNRQIAQAWAAAQ